CTYISTRPGGTWCGRMMYLRPFSSAPVVSRSSVGSGWAGARIGSNAHAAAKTRRKSWRFMEDSLVVQTCWPMRPRNSIGLSVPKQPAGPPALRLGGKTPLQHPSCSLVDLGPDFVFIQVRQADSPPLPIGQAPVLRNPFERAVLSPGLPLGQFQGQG